MPYKRRRKYRRKTSLDDVTKLTVDASRMLIGTSVSLAVLKGATEALKVK